MIKRGFFYLIGLSLTLACLRASDRIPDIVTFQGELYHLQNTFPLDTYISNYRLFPKYNNAPMLVTKRGQMDGTNNPNFHIATWVIRNNRLYLTHIEGFVYPDFNAWYLESLEKNLEQTVSSSDRNRLQEELTEYRAKVTNRMVKPAMAYFFPAAPPGQAVHAEWFSGLMILDRHSLSAFPSQKPKRYELIFNRGILQNVRRL